LFAFLEINENDERFNSTIENLFHGDNAIDFTLCALTPGDTQYAVCTTLQYSQYKPAANTTLLTVEPQAAQETQPYKTPEEVQQEAENSGWFSIWHEFSWWYPWYRCHLVVNATLSQGVLWMDYGWTPLPSLPPLPPFLQGPTFECNDVAASVLNQIAIDVLFDLVKGYITAKLIQHGAAVLLGKTLIGAVVAVATYTATCLIQTWQLYANSGNNPDAWLAAFISSAIGGTFGLFEAKLYNLIQFLTAAGRRLLGEISHIMNSFWARGLNFFEITGIAFSLIDFAFMAFYLVQFVTMV
jgi:hypothetical protein